MTNLDHHLDRFVARLRARLEAGAATYGDASFTRPAAELVDEVQQELEDVCGWGLLLWLRLDRLRPVVERTKHSLDIATNPFPSPLEHAMNPPDTNQSHPHQPGLLQNALLEMTCTMGAKLNELAPQLVESDYWSLLSKLQISVVVAHAVQSVAMHQGIANRANWPLLPTNFELVLALGQLPLTTVEQCLANGRIHPAMTAEELHDIWPRDSSHLPIAPGPRRA